MKTIFIITLISFVFLGINCSEETSVESSQNEIKILKLNAIPDSIKVKETCIVVCFTNAVESDTIIYDWSATEGTISEFGEYIEWTAPGQEGNYQVKCRVTDQSGKTDTSSVNINVQKIPFSITNLLVLPDNILTDEICTITCQTNASESDQLTYIWSASEGSFYGSGNSVQWHAPKIEGVYTINCKIISEQTGRMDTASVRINVTGNPALIFYTLDHKIYMCPENELQLQMLASGGYPIWLNSKMLIGYHSPDNFYYHIFDPAMNQIIKTYPISGYGTFTFGRYSEYLGVFVFSVNHHGLPAIAVLDIQGNIQIIKRSYPLYNPAFSGVDDWLYHLNQEDGSFDIYRMKLNGEDEEPIAVSTDFRYGNFSVSYDGRYIVAPKLKDNLHLLAVINTETRSERIIDLSYLQLVGHTSFSKDNRYIFFTGGLQRDVFRINFDGTGLKNLTNSATSYYRPMSW